ncbi:MAG: F0F1 ATP synthase subunit delta [Steroidobacteraceae bacterium]
MADKTTLARPYAKAAFAHANAAKLLGPWSAALAIAAQVVGDARVARLLTSPHVTAAQLADLVLSFMDAAAARGFDEAGHNFLGLLAENRRLGVLPEIAGLFNAMKDEAERSVDVEVTTAVPLDEKRKAALSASMEKRLQRRVRLHCTVDATLLGGAVLRAGDLVIDGSLRSQVDRMAHELMA